MSKTILSCYIIIFKNAILYYTVLHTHLRCRFYGRRIMIRIIKVGRLLNINTTIGRRILGIHRRVNTTTRDVLRWIVTIQIIPILN